MTGLENIRTSSGARRLTVLGAVLLALGLVGVIVFLVMALSETPGTASGQGAVQGAMIVGSAIVCGAGVILLATGVIKSRRRTEGTRAPSATDEPRSLHGGASTPE